MSSISMTLAAAGLILGSSLALAQPGPGPGAGPGLAAGPCATGASAAGPGCPGPAMGPGGRRGPGARWGRDFTPGWGMMSETERLEHRQRLGALSGYDECRSYMDQHHADMVARAKERGVTLPAKPRRDACIGLQPPKK